MVQGREQNSAKAPLRWVLCLEDGSRYGYADKTPLEAIQAHIYCMNLREKDPEAQPLLAGYGRTLYCKHRGKTYATINW